MKLIESAERIQLDDYNKYLLEESTEKYEEYLKEIGCFDSRHLKYYLDTIKQHEITNNHRTESVSQFMITFYSQAMQEDSLTKLIELLNSRQELQTEDIKNLHRILMQGTDCEVGSEDYRQTDNKFVGAFNADGSKRVDYMPIPCDTIDENMDKVIRMLNTTETDNAFINPFIIHGLISVMQPFDDGNTRTSRLLQHGKIWTSTNALYGTSFEQPTIYLSENYLLSRRQYRELINKLAIEESNEAWNAWLKYNLFKVEEQLNYLGNNVAQLKRRLR